MIVEYNSVFGHNQPWTIPYKPDFNRTNYHYSNLIFGCSLLSLCDLANQKDYSFIGCNSNGNNAYFIRNDKLKDLKPLTAEIGFVNSKFREARNLDGSLSFLRERERIEAIKGCEIFNTRTNQIELIK